MQERSQGHDDLSTLGAIAIVRGIRDGLFSAEDVVRACLARIDSRESHIGAWVEVDRKGAINQSRRIARGDPGLLAGVPFGVKDVLDSASLPTQMGSQAYAGHRPRYDAACVAQARGSGGILLGKTVTAEFAGTQPTLTSNPHDFAHTPGGSSSGSAAAVADFMVPFAFGTQTGGSVLRPAAFCGVVGFKPSFGLYSIAGMKPAAHSFDTIGLIARSVDDVALVHGVLMNAVAAVRQDAPPRIGVFRTHLWHTVDDDAQRGFEGVIASLAAAGATIIDVAVPVGFADITQQRAVINAFERARGLAGEWLNDRALFTRQSFEVCERGLAVSGADYLAARRAVDAFRGHAGSLFENVDLLLTPTTPGEAPQGKDYAGDPRLQEIWTMLHLPSLTLPAHRGPHGMPVGVQLVGPKYGDDALLSAAHWVADRLTPAVSHPG